MNTQAAAYCSLGVFLSQAAHVLLWARHGTPGVDSLWGSPLDERLAFWASPLLGVLTFSSLRVIGTSRIWTYRNALVVGVLLLVSQVAGRSVIKLFFEASFFAVAFAGVFLSDLSARWRTVQGRYAVEVAHREAWDVLKLALTFSMFWAGTVGLGISTQLLKDLYFRGSELVPGEMVRYAVMVFYTLAGIVIHGFRPIAQDVSRLQGHLLGISDDPRGTGAAVGDPDRPEPTANDPGP